MKYAVQTIQGTYAETLEWAQWAESAGLEAFAMPDHYVRGSGEPPEPALDALSVVAGLARETDSIELVLLVSPVTWRHPAVLAKTAATVQDMADGRLTLGVGTGWMEREHTLFGLPFPEIDERFEMLEEALGYLRAAFDEPPRSFEGKHYTFEAFEMLPRPDLRLVVGGMGATKTPRLTGAFADEFNIFPAAPDDFAARLDIARSAATDAGRDPEAMLVSSSGVIVAGDTEEEFRERLTWVAERFGTTPERMEAGMTRRHAPIGTWDRMREGMAALEDQGVERFYLQAVGQDMTDIDHALKMLEEA